MQKYGKAGDKWPVRPGDVWQAGPHIFACCDHETDDPAMFVHQYGPFDMVFVDPPWNKAMASSYRTKAGVPDAVDFDNLSMRIFMLVQQATKGDVFIEIGKQKVGYFAALVEELGGRSLRQWPVTYYKTREAWLIHATFGEETALEDDPSGMDDMALPEWSILRCSPEGGSVFDPCMGQGLVAEAADKCGRVVYGTELHPRRLAVTLDKLNKRGHEPRCVGRM